MKNLMKKLIVLALPVFLIPFFSYAGAINVNTVYSTIGTTEVTVYGSVNPGGIMTTAWFEYSEDMNFLNYKESNHVFVGSQGNEFPIRATLTNLKPDTIYYVRAVADNTQGTVRGNTVMLTTNPRIENNTNIINVQNTNISQVKSANTTKKVETKIVYINTNNNFSNYNSNQNYNSNYSKDLNPNYNQSANILFSYNDFMPNTFFGWLILILLVFAILSVIRRLFFYY
ncbi:MAG: fibronectin type III domain-containing protein [Candidatus Pacebacteria bacterium]|nr:fibronectin type III domain-containing protein [Candidatus Paceibacterota bacterium]